ncbi:MAG: hypothetical protein ACOYL9_09865 [Ilumatobacteraceae bacterium]
MDHQGRLSNRPHHFGRAIEILPGVLARQVRRDVATGKLQRQRRLTRSEVDNLVDLYATGINVRQLAAATRRYLAGEPMAKLCSDLGINPTTLRRELTKTGVQLRPPGRPPTLRDV